MKRFVLTLVLIPFLVLSACGPTANEDDTGPLPGVNATPAPSANASQQPTAVASGVTISYAAWESDIPTYERFAAKFHQENPSINVVIIPMDDLTSSSNSNGSQDVITQFRQVVSGADTAPTYYLPPEVASAKLVLDLKPLMEADAGFKRDDFYPGALERSNYAAGMFVLPRYVYAQVLSYNKNLFKAANLPAPTATWTWRDLLGAAEQIASSDSKAYGYFDTSGGFSAVVADIEQRKLKLFGVPPADVDLTKPEFVDLLKTAKTRSDNRSVLVPSQKAGQPDPQQLIRDGRVAIFSADALGGKDGSPNAPPPAFEIGTLPYPHGAGILDASAGSAEGYIVSAGTQHPNEAWKWIEYLSRQNVDQQGSSNSPGRVPARISLADATNYWQTVDAETKAAYQAVLAQPVQQLDQTLDYTVVGPLNQAVNDVLTNNAKPEQALKTAQDALKAQLADQVKLTPTSKPDTSPVVVATPAPQIAPEGAKLVTFDVAGTQASVFRRLAQQFNQQKNGYFVQIKSTQSVTQPLALTDIAKRSDCFVFYSSPQAPEEFAALLDLHPLIDGDATFKRDDFPAAVLGQFTNNGGLYALPYSFNLRTLGYNKTLFEKTGQAVPNFNWKPDDFLAAAKALTSGTGDKKTYGYVPYGSGPSGDMLFFINQFGGQISTGSGTNAKPNFADPKVVQAIQWYIDLANVHSVMPKFTIPYRPSDNSNDQSYDLVQNGRAGMWLDYGTGSFGDANGPGSGQELGWQPAYAPIPVGAAGLQSGDLYARGMFISATSQQQQGCWEWLKLLSTDVSNLSGDYPARISVAQSEAFSKAATPRQLDIYKTYSEALTKQSTINPGMAALYSANGSGVDLYWFYKAIDETITKGANLAEGMQTANDLTIKHLACVAETKKAATCAKKVDPTYNGYNTEDVDPNKPNPAG